MIGSSKNKEKIIRESTFEHKKKDTGVKFNPGLSANRPLNNRSKLVRIVMQNFGR